MVSFGTAGIRGDVTATMTPKSAVAVGRAIAEMADTIVVGRDGRTSSPALARAVGAGVLSGGAKLLHVGMVPTPALAWASKDRIGVMITASHNPASDNGIKLFNDGEEFDEQEEDLVESTVAKQPAPVEWNQWHECRRQDVLETYRRAVSTYLSSFGEDPDDLVVGIDCGNGMGGLVTPKLLRDMGATVKAFNASPDGHFPARSSKPTARSLKVFSETIACSEIDIGLAHDGDADRLVVLDKQGTIVHEDTILAIIAHHFVDGSDDPEPIVITTPNASTRIDDRVNAAGGSVERTKLGGLHEGIANATANTQNTVVFAAEPWKHIHPQLGGWIDGIASAGLIVRLAAAAGGLARLRDPIREQPYRKMSFPCPDNHKADVLKGLTKSLPVAYPNASVDTSHGLRLSWADGSWTLLRPSGTEAKFRIYFEAPELEPRLGEIVSIVEEHIERVRGAG